MQKYADQNQQALNGDVGAQLRARVTQSLVNRPKQAQVAISIVHVPNDGATFALSQVYCYTWLHWGPAVAWPPTP